MEANIDSGSPLQERVMKAGVEWRFIGKTCISKKVLHINVLCHLVNGLSIVKIAQMFNDQGANNNPRVQSRATRAAYTYILKVQRTNFVPWN